MKPRSHYPSTRFLVAFVGALATALTACIALGGWFVHRDHERTVVALTEHWQPAQATLTQLRDAVDEVQADCLVNAPGDPAVQRQARQRLDADIPRLEQLVADSRGLRTATNDLADAVHRSVDTVLAPGTTDRCSMASTASSDAESAADAGFLSVQSRADRVQSLLDSTVRHAQQDAEDGATTLLLYVLGMCVAAVLAVLAGTVLISSRVLAPVARIEAQLRAAATGLTHEPHLGLDALVGPELMDPELAPPRRGLLTRLAHEADRTRLHMAQIRSQAGRDQAALAQHGPAATGIHRILTAREDPSPGVVVDASLVAAEGLIAGDFLGALPLPGERTALLVGDVSGHGVEAGLLATQLKVAVQAALRAGLGLVEAACSAWGAVAHEEERFSTLAIVVIDPGAKTLHWLNAGHEEPYLLRASGEVERLAPTGPLVHPMLPPEEDSWHVGTARFRPGDLLVLTTDGLAEGRSRDSAQRAEQDQRAESVEFGEEGVVEVLRSLPDHEPATAVQALLHAVRRRGIDWGRDDITVLAAGTRPV